MQRREFLGSLAAGGLAVSLNSAALAADAASADAGAGTAASSPSYHHELSAATRFFDGKQSWCHPRAGAIPPRAPGNDSDLPIVVMTLQRLDLSGSDVFGGLQQMRTDDLGKTWQPPAPIPGFELRTLPDGHEETVCDFTPQWHAASGKLLGTGHTVVYRNRRIPKTRPRSTAYSSYDPATSRWSAWRALEMPDAKRFHDAGAGSTQRLDLPNGDILLPVYFRDNLKSATSKSTVVRCRFDGETLRYIEHGTELSLDIPRGFGEPSIARVGDRFYLTLRNDKDGYVAASNDGLHYDTPRPWQWDDGSSLGNYNTQQHWVTHGGNLYLVYTRRGADNDHVFRHRAPLFMAQVDQKTLRVVRETEQALMPNRGARLGNFGVTEVSPKETWVTSAEWMQPKGCEKYGADGSVWVSRIRW